MLRLLTFTTLYPNAAQPTHGVFVENRLRALVGTGQASSRVLAPVAFYPAGLPGPAEWRLRAQVPGREQRHGLELRHPRYLTIPRVGAGAAAALLLAGAAPALRRMLREEPADAIDAHYVYPDGVAAIRLGQFARRPVVITARGSDVTQLPDFALPRRQIRWAVARADALIAVSAALAERLVALGASPDRVSVLRNGVDAELFRPAADRAAARAALHLDRPTLLSVGHLIERKGHDRSIAALPHLPDAVLQIAGAGPLRSALEALAAKLGVADRVRFLGAQPQAALPALYSAADAMVLASSREGWANVLLESMACGTPVVASPIPGNPEVVQTRDAGVIAPTNTPEGIAEAVRDLLGSPPDRAATRAYAERFGWAQTSAGQLEVFRRIL